jgi:hypothetical protein
MSKKTKITKTIKIEKPGKPTMTVGVEKVLPENISDSEIDRLIERPDYIESVSNLREWWISQGDRPCAYIKCTNRLPKNAKETQKYCSSLCQRDAKAWRYRTKNPKAKMKSNKDYLDGLEEEDFID